MSLKIFLNFAVLIVFSWGVMGQTTIEFAGQTWDVRSGTGNPGNNNWSDAGESVWVDSSGNLHLKIRKVGDLWYCSEIVSKQSFGYGEYIFYVASNVEKYDPNVVAAMFTYENDKREIDIEFTGSGFGNPLYMETKGWYTVQPKPYTTVNQKRFKLNLTEDYSSHKFIWSSANIFFQSYHGHYPQLPTDEYLIEQWIYTGNKNPPAGNERLHLNLYLLGGQPPTDQKEVEFVINAVYVPLGSLNVVLSPVAAVDAGAMWRIDDGEWQSSGSTLSKLSNCEHTISFKSAPGWRAPADTTVLVISNQIVNIQTQYQINTNNISIEEPEIKIYPNPVSENLYIEMPQSFGKATVKIFDQTSRLVYTRPNLNSSDFIDVSSFFEGVYFLHISAEKKSIVKKVFVLR